MFWTKDSHLVGYTQHTHLKWLGFGCDLVKIAMCYRVYVYASLLPFFMPFGGTVSYVFGPPCFCENQGTETKENINMKTITVFFNQKTWFALCKGRSHRFAKSLPMVQFLAISKIELKIHNFLQTKQQKVDLKNTHTKK